MNWTDLSEMSDTEKLDEILTHMRTVAEAMQALSKSPMAQTFGIKF